MRRRLESPGPTGLHRSQSKKATYKYVGAAIRPENRVKQGCPFSPIAYICVFQTCLSLLETSELRGIQVPGPLGDASRPEAIKATAFADDLLAFLRGPSELTLFRDLLVV